MSANFDYWRRLVDSPLPFVNDTQAGNGAYQQPVGTPGQPAQDTGWIARGAGPITTGGGNPIYATPGGGWGHNPPAGTGWSGPSTQVPYTAPSTTGGATGTWDVPGWAYGGNQRGASVYNKQTGQWDPTGTVAAGSDVFGAQIPVGYDPRQDRGGLNLSGNDVETFWSKFLRLTKDLTDGGTPVQQAMQATIDRLRKDNGGTLAGTGFAESGAAGTSGGTGSAGAGGAGGSTGGNGVSAPTLPMGQGLAAGATVAGGGGSADPNGLVGSAGGIDQLYQNDQAYRTAQLLKALGLGDINSRLSYGGSVVARQAPGLFEAWREAQGIGGGGVPNGTGQLGAFANVYNAPGALGNIAQTGQHALDWLMGSGQQGLSDQELIPLIQGFEKLSNIRQSDTMNQYYNNLTDQGLGQFLQGIGPSNLNARLAPFLQGNPLFGFLTGKR